MTQQNEKSVWKKRIKKTVAALIIGFVSLLAIIVVADIWDAYDFASRKGLADDASLAREEKLWRELVEISLGTEECKTKIHSSISVSKADDSSKPVIVDIENSRKAAAECAHKLREHKKNLQQMSDDADFDYRREALMLLALQMRLADLHQMGWEIRVNAEAKFGRRMDNALYDEFYKMCRQENKGRNWVFLDRNSKDYEYRIVFSGLLWNSHICAREHSGYRLYQDGSLSTLFNDFESAAVLPMVKDPALIEAKLRCLERRQQHGSAFAAVWRPVKFFLWRKLVQYTTMRGLGKAEAKGGNYLESPAEPYYLKMELTPEDRLWNAAQYLAFNTDNYLWTVKFGDDRHAADSKLQKIHIRPRYSKNSQEMRFYYDSLRRDLQLTAGSLKAEEFKELPDMKKTALRLCTAAEGILNTWMSYRTGKIDYNTFCIALQKDEAAFNQVRSELLKERWDYLYDRFQGSDGCVISSLMYDGVAYPALKQVIEEKQKQAENPAK